MSNQSWEEIETDWELMLIVQKVIYTMYKTSKIIAFPKFDLHGKFNKLVSFPIEDIQKIAICIFEDKTDHFTVMIFDKEDKSEGITLRGIEHVKMFVDANELELTTKRTLEVGRERTS